MSNRQPRGPRGGRPLNPRDLKNIGENSKRTIRRLLGLLRPYRARLSLVFLCIVISAGAGILGSMFTRILIDDYITPPYRPGEPRLYRAYKGPCHHGVHIPCGHAVYLYL